MFLSIALILCGFAALFVLWPVLRGASKRGAIVPGYDAVIRAVYRHRVEEIATEMEDVLLLDELRRELDAVLLTDQITEQPTAPVPVTGTGMRPRWLVGLATLVPALALGLYYQISDPHLISLRGAESVLTASADDPELESWRLRLSARVGSVPDDNLSWYLLGHTFLKLDRFAEAAKAFSTTIDIAGDDLNVLLYWLQARYLDSRGLLDEVSRGIADKLLAAHPDFPVVLEMLALDAFRRGAYPEAVKFLHRGIASTADFSQQAVFATAISQVRTNLEAMPGVTVVVSAGSKVPGEATIFIIARPVGGGLPYAVVRRPALLVPFSVRLDDLVGMSEVHLLSTADRFEVIVRLSLTGVAMAQEGDWQWQSPVLVLGDTELPTLDARLAPP